MNHNMQGMTKKIPKLFAMLKSAKVEIKKKSSVDGSQDHQFQEKGQREEGELQEERQASCCSSEKPKSGPKPKTECFYYKGTGHWKWNYPK